MSRQAAIEYDDLYTHSRRYVDFITSDQESALFLGHLQNPVLSPKSIGNSGRRYTTSTGSVKSPLQTESEDNSACFPYSRPRPLIPLPSIEEDPEENHHQHTSSISIVSTRSGPLASICPITPSQPVLPAPNCIQTLLQHLEEIGQASGVEGILETDSKYIEIIVLFSHPQAERFRDRAKLTDCERRVW
jgi:hypothetical protein